MKKKYFIILIATAFNSFAQNLLQNYSFENISSCPTASGQFTLVNNWINPSQAGTSDLYSTCATGGLGLPNNVFFYQMPKTGNNIAGIWCYNKFFNNSREYIQTQLTTPLVLNNIYIIKYYINKTNWAIYAVNNLGALLSVNQVSITGTSNYLISNNNSLKKFNNQIITDTLNWIEISAVYKSLGGEQYLTIGNFENDITTDTLNYCPTCSQPGAYYFIDDVSVENITTPQWQYLDTTIYLGDSVLIGPAINGLNVDWFDVSNTFIKNAPGIYVKPTITTPYQASETFNSVTYNHTVTVTVLSPVKVNKYDKLQNSIKLFPNPSNGNFNLQFDDFKSGDVEVNISDIAGKIVYKNKFQQSGNKINLDINLENGVYFMEIINSKLNATVVKKIIIQK